MECFESVHLWPGADHVPRHCIFKAVSPLKRLK
jgi:hypothetical protein